MAQGLVAGVLQLSGALTNRVHYATVKHIVLYQHVVQQQDRLALGLMDYVLMHSRMQYDKALQDT